MPVIGLGLPGGNWHELKWVLSTKPDGTPANAVAYGAFLGNVVDFIIAFVIYLFTKTLHGWGGWSGAVSRHRPPRDEDAAFILTQLR